MSIRSEKRRGNPRWKERLRRGWGRLLRSLFLGLGGLVLSQTGTAQQNVPSHWASYARLVSNQFQAWLSDDSQPDGERLLNWVGAGFAPPSIVVRVWIAADGRIQKIESESLGDPVMDDTLQQVLSARPLAEPPPRDMRQPLILRLGLEALDEPAGEQD